LQGSKWKEPQIEERLKVFHRWLQSATWTLAKKELRLLLRDYRALVILVAMPLIFIVVLGMSVGEGFGQKADDKLRVSVVILDKGLPAATPIEFQPPGAATWSDLVLKDLNETADIRVEVIDSQARAEDLVRRSERAAVLVLGPQFSMRASACSFLAGQDRPKELPADVPPELYVGINPFEREGVRLSMLDVTLLQDPSQEMAASIVSQVAQGTMLRIVLPWMIGRAFETLGKEEFIAKLGKSMEVPVFGTPVKLESVLKTSAQREAVGKSVQAAIREHFSRFNLTAKTWDALTKAQGKGKGGAITRYEEEGTGLLKLGSQRYKVLVPSYTVMFSYFLVLSIGWLFVAERRQGTLKRLCAAPITRAEILLGKLAPCYLVSVVQGAVLILAGRWLFQMNWGSEPWWLIPVILSTSLAALGMGILVAAVARTEAQVAIYGSLLVLVLAGLSGCLMGNRSLMPEAIQHISLVTPMAWSLDAYLQLIARPQPDIELVIRACMVLVLFGAGFLVLAWRFMRLE
jgi:ABC-type Na+ efflux pump permease subunit